jgi:putative oxygen-independent coproporphyrinogen III oxidase
MNLAVYVHFPWCLQRCPYCDFATEAINPSRIPHARYADAVVRELGLRLDALPPGARARTLFFGGGTPSLWEPADLGRVIAAVARRGELHEITVECNPTSLDAERCARWKDLGVDRVSIGVQSLRDEHLRYLGRLHNAAGASLAVQTAVRSGALRVSADVMFGLAEQTIEALTEDLRALLGEGVEHLSCYALTIEPGTRFGELARKGRLPRLEDDRVATMYEAVERTCEDAGLGHYEVSNYARPGATSRHNEAYWRGEWYLGLGAGAVGCTAVTEDGRAGERWRNAADAEAYCTALERGEFPPGETEAIGPETRVQEGLMLGLRTALGVDLAGLAARTGVDPRVGREAAVARECARGNLIDEGVRWSIPRSRWLLADDIVARLF